MGIHSPRAFPREVVIVFFYRWLKNNWILTNQFFNLSSAGEANGPRMVKPQIRCQLIGYLLIIGPEARQEPTGGMYCLIRRGEIPVLEGESLIRVRCPWV